MFSLCCCLFRYFHSHLIFATVFLWRPFHYAIIFFLSMMPFSRFADADAFIITAFAVAFAFIISLFFSFRFRFRYACHTLSLATLMLPLMPLMLLLMLFRYVTLSPCCVDRYAAALLLPCCHVAATRDTPRHACYAAAAAAIDMPFSMARRSHTPEQHTFATVLMLMLLSPLRGAAPRAALSPPYHVTVTNNTSYATVIAGSC